MVCFSSLSVLSPTANLAVTVRLCFNSLLSNEETRLSVVAISQTGIQLISVFEQITVLSRPAGVVNCFEFARVSAGRSSYDIYSNA